MSVLVSRNKRTSKWHFAAIPYSKVQFGRLLTHEHWMRQCPIAQPSVGWPITGRVILKEEETPLARRYERNLEYQSRANLRMLVGLSPEYDEDSEGIKALSGSISWIADEKIDVTEIIRDMRDNDE